MIDIGPGSSLTGCGDRIGHLFGDGTRIAHALGLDIELPDSDNEEPAYRDPVHAVGVTSSVLMARSPTRGGMVTRTGRYCSGSPGEVWFDIEEGMKLFLIADDIPRALLLIGSLRAKVSALATRQGSSYFTSRRSRCALHDRALDAAKLSVTANYVAADRASAPAVKTI